MGLLRLVVALVVSLALALASLGAASGRYGGTLYVGVQFGMPDTLDPTESRAGSGIEIDLAMCQKLYTVVSNHGRLEDAPQLAASLPVMSKDKLSYTIKLRQGILFNDGTPFNSQAVVASIQRLMTDPLSTRSTDYESVASITADGPYAVVFHMKARDATLVGNYMFVYSPTALAQGGANFAANPVCVGPFMFDHEVAGDSLTLIKSPYYYAKGSIHLDKIVYVSEAGAPGVQELEAGAVQALDNVAPPEVPGVQENNGFRMLSTPQLGWNGILINIGNAHGVDVLPYHNVGTQFSSSPLLREAFSEAIDRNALNRVLFGGLYQPSCTPIPPANTTWYAAIKVPCVFDPAAARRLVARSGVANPTVDLMVTGTTDMGNLAQFIQVEEKAVGINVVIDPTAGVGTHLAKGTFDAAVNAYEPGADGEPNLIISQFFQTQGVRNYVGYSNNRLDYVLANGLKATQLADRAVNYRVAQQILLSDVPAVFLYNTVIHAAYSSNLSGVQLTANGLLDVTHAQFN
jgi:peptide/nickel transport system substrate-binding protein